MRIGIFPLIMALFPYSAAAIPGPLEAALRTAWENSAQLSGQASLVSLSEGDRWRRFVPNDPLVQYSNSDDDTARSYGLSLVVPFPGKSIALAKLDSAKALQAGSELAAKKHDLTRLIAQAFLDCAAAAEGANLQQSTSEDLDLIFRSLKALYEGGRSSQAEKIGAELQARQSNLDLITARDKRATLCAKYETLLSRESKLTAGSLQSPTSVPEDLDGGIIAELGTATADQARATGAIGAATAADSTRWWAQVPDFSLAAQRNRYVYLPGSPSGKEWTTTYSIAVSLPIFLPAHQAAEARRTEGQSKVDADTAEVLRISANSDQMDAAKEYRRNRARLAELRAHDLPLAEAWYEGTSSGYRSGKFSFADLVLSRKTLTDLKNQDIQLRVSVVSARVRCLASCEASAQVKQ
jgi:outer membrane protein TolC